MFKAALYKVPMAQNHAWRLTKHWVVSDVCSLWRTVLTCKQRKRQYRARLGNKTLRKSRGKLLLRDTTSVVQTLRAGILPHWRSRKRNNVCNRVQITKYRLEWAISMPVGALGNSRESSLSTPVHPQQQLSAQIRPSYPATNRHPRKYLTTAKVEAHVLACGTPNVVPRPSRWSGIPV